MAISSLTVGGFFKSIGRSQPTIEVRPKYDPGRGELVGARVSMIQPLLLLKQTLECDFRSWAIRLFYGPNRQIRQRIDQMTSRVAELRAMLIGIGLVNGVLDRPFDFAGLRFVVSEVTLSTWIRASRGELQSQNTSSQEQASVRSANPTAALQFEAVPIEILPSRDRLGAGRPVTKL